MIPWLDGHEPFPPVERALRDPNGLLAAGGDLSPQRLLEAYAHGIFPWFSDDDPLLWWSPDPRMVLFLDELHVAKSLRKVIKSRRFTVTFDRAFNDVMAGCAAPRVGEAGTWITREMHAAYALLHRLGFAHSVETWNGDRLVGGLYGVAIGRMFYGESMFASESNASKVAFATLVRQLERWGFEMIDCQMSTDHLASLGAREIPRAEFVSRLARLVRQGEVPVPWRLDGDLLEERNVRADERPI
jgi:leucyl/phenylalanyl-tRNA---protein transferase